MTIAQKIFYVPNVDENHSFQIGYFGIY